METGLHNEDSCEQQANGIHFYTMICSWVDWEFVWVLNAFYKFMLVCLEPSDFALLFYRLDIFSVQLFTKGCRKSCENRKRHLWADIVHIEPGGQNASRGPSVDVAKQLSKMKLRFLDIVRRPFPAAMYYPHYLVLTEDFCSWIGMWW